MSKQTLRYKYNMLKFIQQIELSPICYTWKSTDNPSKPKGRVLSVDNWNHSGTQYVDITAYQPKNHNPLEYIVEISHIRTQPYATHKEIFNGRYAKKMFDIMNQAYKAGKIK